MILHRAIVLASQKHLYLDNVSKHSQKPWRLTPKFLLCFIHIARYVAQQSPCLNKLWNCFYSYISNNFKGIGDVMDICFNVDRNVPNVALQKVLGNRLSPDVTKPLPDSISSRKPCGFHLRTISRGIRKVSIIKAFLNIIHKYFSHISQAQ